MSEVNNDQRLNIISKLPDEILQTILDKLPVIDAVSTGFLSRRWRDLWKYISVVEFDPSWVQLTGKDIISSLNQFICLHKGQKIQRFSVRFTYQPEMSATVDSWVLFAINKHVEDLDLDFDVTDNNIIENTAYAPCHKLLPNVFNNRSIVRLVLSFCDLELPMSIQLQSLKVLQLHRIELPQDAIQMLTSNAPILEQLFLSDCNRTKDLQIHVAPNPHFSDLVIVENFFPVNHTTKMYIKAPTAFQVAFMGSMPRSKYIIEEVQECDEAHFSLQGMFSACGKYGLNILVDDSSALRYEYVLLELLIRFRSSDTFHMCNWCIQVFYSY
ncbi:F-box/LRR-repeat protein At3g03360-like [Mercurialis annua]|uniref:F-box/LRR-repeat protein At3g03360-like n=1 Tax=Mercurialis annua TaxID=3986 RepID=UPI0024ADA3C7|nr:F-box/LRR-repeat protein At3g03360-like [Mercurialis annua]